MLLELKCYTSRSGVSDVKSKIFKPYSRRILHSPKGNRFFLLEQMKDVTKQHYFDVEVACKLGVNCSIIYTNISYWVTRNKSFGKHNHDGFFWSFCSVSGFMKYCPYLSEKQIRTSLLKLEDAGYIKSGEYNKVSYDRTKWYTVSGDLGKDPDYKEEIPSALQGKWNLPSGQMELDKRDKPILFNIKDNIKNTNIPPENKFSDPNGEVEEPKNFEKKEEKKKSSAKKEKKIIKVAGLSVEQSKETFRGIKESFKNIYQEIEKTEYYFTAVDASKIYSIIKKIYFKLEEAKGNGYITTPEELITTGSFFIRASHTNGDNFIKANFNLSILDSKFNDIYTQLKNRRNGQSTNSKQSSWEKHANSIFAPSSRKNGYSSPKESAYERAKNGIFSPNI